MPSWSCCRRVSAAHLVFPPARSSYLLYFPALPVQVQTTHIRLRLCTERFMWGSGIRQAYCWRTLVQYVAASGPTLLATSSTRGPSSSALKCAPGR
ncbi:hypothetical protein C8T65DRAFT_671437 [Cerioporus squamosus]|nr:hypothetical protein C8T65DRAFT_671437 [Cerioporus squamosus]